MNPKMESLARAWMRHPGFDFMPGMMLMVNGSPCRVCRVDGGTVLVLEERGRALGAFQRDTSWTVLPDLSDLTTQGLFHLSMHMFRPLEAEYMDLSLTLSFERIAEDEQRREAIAGMAAAGPAVDEP